MKKQGLLNLIKQIAAQSEKEEIDDLRPIQVLDIILDYINDIDIRKAVDEVLM